MSVKRRSSQRLSATSSTPSIAASSAQPAAQRVRNPQGQGGRLRAELIAAADQILAHIGNVEELSLRAVARKVGIATPSIYLHFPDKSALVRAVLEARFGELAEAVQTAVAATPDPARRLRAGCLAYCRFATEHPNAYRVLFGRVPGPPARRADQPPSGDVEPTVPSDAEPPAPPATSTAPPGSASYPGTAAFGFLVDSIAVYIRAGLAPDGDPFRVATNVWTALHGIVSLRSATPGFPWPALEQQVDDVLTGLVGARHNPPAVEG